MIERSLTTLKWINEHLCITVEVLDLVRSNILVNNFCDKDLITSIFTLLKFMFISLFYLSSQKFKFLKKVFPMSF
jgi:hypothetical protein